MFEDEEEEKEEEAEMVRQRRQSVRNRCNIWLGAANGFRIQHKSWACLRRPYLILWTTKSTAAQPKTGKERSAASRRCACYNASKAARCALAAELR